MDGWMYLTVNKVLNVMVVHLSQASVALYQVTLSATQVDLTVLWQRPQGNSITITSEPYFGSL